MTRPCLCDSCRPVATIELSPYEYNALKTLLEQTGCALRWGVKGDHNQLAYHLCNGDWGHQIYAKLLAAEVPK